jgi:hypothetical protein
MGSHKSADEEPLMLRRNAVPISAVIVLGLAIGINHGAWAQESSPAAAPTQASTEGLVSATVVTVHGKIVKVNKARKQVTLEGPEGRRVTLDVQNPYNLNAAKVGAPFVARYYEIVTVRKKKPGETVPSASLKGGIATATPGGVPGAAGEMHLTLLVTVEAIDESKGTVTIKGPDGSVETVKARNPQNLKRLKVGDDLVVSISRAIAISLEKESGSGAS